MQHPFPNEHKNEQPPDEPEIAVERVRPHRRAQQCGHYKPDGEPCEKSAVYDVIHVDGTELPVCGRHYSGPKAIE